MKKKSIAPKEKNAALPIILILIASFLLFFVDGILLNGIQGLRHGFLDSVLGFFANFLVICMLFLIFPAIALLLRNKIREAFLLSMAFLLSCAIAIALKFVFLRPRPQISDAFFAQSVYYSFPSLHTMVVFALLPLLILSFPKLKGYLISFSVLVGFSRLYFGVHYPSDVLFGALFGLAIGWYLSHDHVMRPGTIRCFLDSNRFELRRKSMHITLGLLIVLLIQFGILGAYSLGALAILGFGLSYLERSCRLPLLSPLLDIFERSAVRKKLPAKGMLMFILASSLSLFLFPKDIALASIMALTFGDSISHLFGVHFGKVIHPLSDKKFLEGAIAGFLAASLGALLFVPLHEALIAAAVAMVIEGLEVRFRRIRVDDNLLIPLAAGAALLLFRYLTSSPFPYL